MATFGPPKTVSSFRTIPLADFVVDALAAHIADHSVGVDGLILHGPNGGPLSYAKFGRVFRAARKQAGVPSVHFHDLRHTFASTLLSQGVSVKAVADWLGHASPVMTLNIYSHLMPIDETRARAVIQAALAPQPVSIPCHAIDGG